MVFGHMAVLNKVDLISKEAIIREAKAVRAYDVPVTTMQARRLRKITGQPVGAVYLEGCAPRVFKNLRRMHDIGENGVAEAFSEINLRNKTLMKEHTGGERKLVIRAPAMGLKLMEISDT